MSRDLRSETFQDELARLFNPERDPSRVLARNITFQVTEDCCLACSYCYQVNKSHSKMSFETAKAAMDEILSNDPRTKDYIDSYTAGGVILEFIGGEPFMEIELIDKITDYFISELIRLRHPWATRYSISICSNGILYFDPRVQAYLKKNLSHLSFSISIDGDKTLHDSCRKFPNGEGSYDRAIAAVKHFREELGGYMGSKMTIAPENVKYLKSAVVSLIENGYTDINLNCVYENVWWPEHATELYYQLKAVADYLIENDLVEKIRLSMLSPVWQGKRTDDSNWCGGDGRMLAIDWQGKYYPCLRYMGSSLNGEQVPYEIGDIETGIGQTEQTKSRIELLRRITVSSQSEQKCLDCPISTGCGWCTAYNYQLYGTPDKRATFICQMHQAQVLATAYLWNSWYKKMGASERYTVIVPEEWATQFIPKEEYDMIKLGGSE